ncbi:RNA polymerase sigma factor [Bacteroides caecicola]|uniref:RNA polymerase sigma factor n=1 Tax=Bacteroides caecicola TaxID=1462569 RepID=UPI002012A9CB|nr:sigma-70 family RNA polymerase sigma factor [Bacteroides caecicola]MCL1626922.1 sigma-70 family RNA polymerase sigma factor [Bacteroides caecicola]
MDKMNKKETDFIRILKEYKTTIYTVCFMFSKDKDEVNDMYQEVSINLWKGFDNFAQKSEMKTWIYRISLNTCISFDRKKKRRKTVPLTVDIDLFEDNDHESKQIKALYNRINKLEPFDRAIILLWLENLPYDEIGAIVGISTKNVSVRLSRIREQLKNMHP